MTLATCADVIDVRELIDVRPTGHLLLRVVVLCGAVALLDGSNTTSIGLAAPLIAEQLGLSQAYLGPIFSSATFGAMLGALSFGLLADRFGRKRMLVIATLIFGVFTMATASATSFKGLLAVRFLAGIGLGGAAPCFIALASEYAPSSRRAMVTGLIWTAFPLGVILGAMLNASLLVRGSWPIIFVLGGLLSIGVCGALLLWLPESVSFLVLHRPHSAETRRIVSSLAPTLRSDAILSAGHSGAPEAPLRNLFADGRAVETLLIWVAFIAAFGMTAATFYWSPVLLHNHGFSVSAASLIVGVGAGFGSLIGAAAAGVLVAKAGPVVTLGATFLIATFTTAALGYSTDSPLHMIVSVIANGTLLAGVSTAGVLAFSAGIYPVAIRSTGVGAAMGVARLGEVVLPLLISAMMTASGGLGKNVFLALALVPLLGALAILLFGWRSRRPTTVLRARME